MLFVGTKPNAIEAPNTNERRIELIFMMIEGFWLYSNSVCVDDVCIMSRCREFMRSIDQSFVGAREASEKRDHTEKKAEEVI